MTPFLRLGAMRSVMFPETGKNVAFTVQNYAYVDSFGRETLTWTRTFEFDPPDPPRRFDETLVFSDKRGCAVVYAGTHQHLAVDLDLSVDDDGAFRLRTLGQRLYEWRVGIPIPMLFSGSADVRESYSDSAKRFEVDVNISSPVWGRIFGYGGWFQLEWCDCWPEAIPVDVRPVREERRE